MQIRRAVQVSLCIALLCAAFGASVRADEWDKKTVVTFGDNVSSTGRSSVPFLTVADGDPGARPCWPGSLGFLSVLAALAAGSSPRRGMPDP